MPKSQAFTYARAVQLLTDDDEALRHLDQFLGLGLLAATPFAPAVTLPLLPAKDEIIRRLADLTKGIRQRTQQATEVKRSDLLEAAHAAIVIDAFMVELSGRLTEMDAEGGWSKEITLWSASRSVAPDAIRDQANKLAPQAKLVDWGCRTVIQPPTPTRPLERVMDELKTLFNTLSRDALNYIASLARWDDLNETQRDRIVESIIKFLPNAAIRRYRSNYLRLAGEAPEFLAWVLINDQTATRRLVSNEANGLKGEIQKINDSIKSLQACIEDDTAALAHMSRMIDALGLSAAGRSSDLPSRSANILETHHSLQRRILKKPVLGSELAINLPGLMFPTVLNGYINPRFRMVEVDMSSGGSLLAQEHWWKERSKPDASNPLGREARPIRTGLAAHLVGHLTTPRATSVPLLVLGHPGSGKSLFSKVIAAQLPRDKYVVARVELRYVNPAWDVAEQVTTALSRESNGKYGWRELSDGTASLLRVVVLDGLDELLQLSSHETMGRYLERVRDFQETEAALGNPTAVIVTARTLIMDRVYVPPETVVLKLEELTKGQIEDWVSLWDQLNDPYFVSNDLHPCPAETVLNHKDLAVQPLLLMMLLLYDADTNALQLMTSLSRAELYEGLFRSFITREVGKASGSERPEEREREIEERFTELSTIALGMFNRGRKFIARDEVERDLRQLGVCRHQGHQHDPMNVTADMALGQFFFLYRAEIVDVDTTVKHGFEFLHATFGEFLIARSLMYGLSQAITSPGQSLNWSRDVTKRALSHIERYLAFRPLAGEPQLLDFLRQVSPSYDCHTMSEMLQQSLAVILDRSQLSSDYRPRDLSPTAISAVWSLNLVVIVATVDDTPINIGTAVLGKEVTPGWQSLVQFWKSQLNPGDWFSVLNRFSVAAESKSIVLHHLPEFPSGQVGSVDPYAGFISRLSLTNAATLDATRLFLEGRFSLDVSLQAAASVWLASTRNLPLDNLSIRGTSFDVIAQAIRFGVGEEWEGQNLRQFMTDLRRQIGEDWSGWDSPLAQAGAGWSDSFLLALANEIGDAQRSGDPATIQLYGLRILCSVLRELTTRGYPDLAHSLIYELRSVPDADESELCDIVFLIQIAHAWGVEYLRVPIGRAITSPWRFEEMASLLGEEISEWFIKPEPEKETKKQAGNLAERLRNEIWRMH